MASHDDPTLGFGTRAIHAGQGPDPTTGAVMTPVYYTSTYVQQAPGVHQGFEYSRTHNLTRFALEGNLASLEGASGSGGALCFASGLAATSTLLQLFDAGTHVIACDDLYGGTFRLFDKVYRRFGFEFTYVDPLAGPAAVEAAVRPSTRLVWVETPTNPMLKIIDIAAVCAVAKQHKAVTCVDNTFCSPYLQNPLALGADIVCHSTTKYIGGHSDAIGGVLACNDTDLHKRLKFIQLSEGAVPGIQECFLFLRSTKTLHVRMDRHCANAMEVARYLEKHAKVQRVIYPGLESHPQHAIAKKQMRGFGGMITIYLKGGLPESRAMLEKVKIFALAESLGGVESLIEHPAIMTHASVPADQRAKLGIADNLVRLSVGIEDVKDLVADLEQALG
jgi:cystathionine gamma-lyase